MYPRRKNVCFGGRVMDRHGGKNGGEKGACIAEKSTANGPVRAPRVRAMNGSQKRSQRKLADCAQPGSGRWAGRRVGGTLV